MKAAQLARWDGTPPLRRLSPTRPTSSCFPPPPRLPRSCTIYWPALLVTLAAVVAAAVVPPGRTAVIPHGGGSGPLHRRIRDVAHDAEAATQPVDTGCWGSRATAAARAAGGTHARSPWLPSTSDNRGRQLPEPPALPAPSSCRRQDQRLLLAGDDATRSFLWSSSAHSVSPSLPQPPPQRLTVSAPSHTTAALTRDPPVTPSLPKPVGTALDTTGRDGDVYTKLVNGHVDLTVGNSGGGGSGFLDRRSTTQTRSRRLAYTDADNIPAMGLGFHGAGAGAYPRRSGRRRLMQDQATSSPAAAVSDPSAPATPPALTAADDSASANTTNCIVLLRYEASVGDPTSTSGDVPVFLGTWTLQAESMKSPAITSWVLGWTFSAGEALDDGTDVYGEGAAALPGGAQAGVVTTGPAAAGSATSLARIWNATVQDLPGGSASAPAADLQRVTVISNSTLMANAPAVSFKIVSHKGPAASSSSANPVIAAFGGPASAPLRVAAPAGVFLNNMNCTPLAYRDRQEQKQSQYADANATDAAGDTASAAEPVAVPLLTTNLPTILQVDYMPIIYRRPVPANTSAAGSNASAAPSGPPAAVAAGSDNGSAAAAAGTGSTPGAITSEELFVSAYTQMFIRIKNLSSRSVIPLNVVKIAYWFEGPIRAGGAYITAAGTTGTGAPGPTTDAPSFIFRCADVSKELVGGCSSLSGQFFIGMRGVRGVRGARYNLIVSFARGSGALLPQNASINGSDPAAGQQQQQQGAGQQQQQQEQHFQAPPDPRWQVPEGTPRLASLDMIVAIQTVNGELMDARQDYSFMDTPILPVPNPVPVGGSGQSRNASTLGSGASIAGTAAAASNRSGQQPGRNATAGAAGVGGQAVVLRKALPNPRIAAYLGSYSSFIAWGSPPTASWATSPEPASDAPISDVNAALPRGNRCQRASGGGLDCTFSMAYCCSTNEPVAPSVPSNWQEIADKQISQPAVGGNVPNPVVAISEPGGSDGGRGKAAAIGGGVGGAAGAMLLAVAAFLFWRRHQPPPPPPPPAPGPHQHRHHHHAGSHRRLIEERFPGVDRRLSRYMGLLMPGVRRSDTGSTASRSSNGGGGGYDGGYDDSQGLVPYEYMGTHQPYPYSPLSAALAVHVTASEGSELHYVLNSGWWQENFPAKGGPLGLGLLPKCPTMPAEAFMAAVTALSRPTSQELRARMASKGTATMAAGTAAAVGEEEGAAEGRGGEAELEGAEGVGGGMRRSRDGGRGEGVTERVATLAAVPGPDDDDVRLRILACKAKTWTGRVAETWELLPDYPPQLLLPPLQPEPAVLQQQLPDQQQQAPSPQAGESYLAPPQPPEAVQGGDTAAAPLFSRCLPRRRTLGTPLAAAAAAGGAGGGGGAGQVPPAEAGREAQAGPPVPPHYMHYLHMRAASIARSPPSFSPRGSLVRGAAAAAMAAAAAAGAAGMSGGGAAGVGAAAAAAAASGPATLTSMNLPMSLTLAPIELDVDYETEVEPFLGRLIGVGGFGRVYEATFRGRKVAVKTVVIEDEKQRQALAKEAQLTARFRNCERVVQLLAASLGLGPAGTQTSSIGGAGRTSQSRRDSRGEAGVDSTVPAPVTPAQPPGAAASLSPSPSPPTPLDQHAPGVGTLPATFATAAGPETLASGADLAGAFMGAGGGHPANHPTRSRHAAAVGSRSANHRGGGGQHAALIMELCEGGNLGDRISNLHMRRLDYLELLQLSRDVAEGLALIHRFGVLHRDLKPGNVLLDNKGRAKIADFGISRLRDPFRSCVNVTQQGGTPNYMAPELFNGTRVDERADIYSLGCIIYEALTRRRPFDNLAKGNAPDGAGGGLPIGGMFAIILAVAIQGRRPKLPEWVPKGLADLVKECWAEDPRARPTAAQVLARLDALIADERASRVARAAARNRPRISQDFATSSSGVTAPVTAAAGSSGVSNIQHTAKAPSPSPSPMLPMGSAPGPVLTPIAPLPAAALQPAASSPPAQVQRQLWMPSGALLPPTEGSGSTHSSMRPPPVTGSSLGTEASAAASAAPSSTPSLPQQPSPQRLSPLAHAGQLGLSLAQMAASVFGAVTGGSGGLREKATAAPPRPSAETPTEAAAAAAEPPPQPLPQPPQLMPRLRLRPAEPQHQRSTLPALAEDSASAASSTPVAHTPMAPSELSPDAAASSTDAASNAEHDATDRRLSSGSGGGKERGSTETDVEEEWDAETVASRRLRKDRSERFFSARSRCDLAHDTGSTGYESPGQESSSTAAPRVRRKGSRATLSRRSTGQTRESDVTTGPADTGCGSSSTDAPSGGNGRKGGKAPCGGGGAVSSTQAVDHRGRGGGSGRGSSGGDGSGPSSHYAAASSGGDGILIGPTGDPPAGVEMVAQGPSRRQTPLDMAVGGGAKGGGSTSSGEENAISSARGVRRGRSVPVPIPLVIPASPTAAAETQRGRSEDGGMYGAGNAFTARGAAGGGDCGAGRGGELRSPAMSASEADIAVAAVGLSSRLGSGAGNGGTNSVSGSGNSGGLSKWWARSLWRRNPSTGSEAQAPQQQQQGQEQQGQVQRRPSFPNVHGPPMTPTGHESGAIWQAHAIQPTPLSHPHPHHHSYSQQQPYSYQSNINDYPQNPSQLVAYGSSPVHSPPSAYTCPSHPQPQLPYPLTNRCMQEQQPPPQRQLPSPWASPVSHSGRAANAALSPLPSPYWPPSSSVASNTVASNANVIAAGSLTPWSAGAAQQHLDAAKAAPAAGSGSPAWGMGAVGGGGEAGTTAGPWGTASGIAEGKGGSSVFVGDEMSSNRVSMGDGGMVVATGGMVAAGLGAPNGSFADQPPIVH